MSACRVGVTCCLTASPTMAATCRKPFQQSVARLDMGFFGLSGTVPPSLGSLGDLQVINWVNNTGEMKICGSASKEVAPPVCISWKFQRKWRFAFTWVFARLQILWAPCLTAWCTPSCMPSMPSTRASAMRHPTAPMPVRPSPTQYQDEHELEELLFVPCSRCGRSHIHHLCHGAACST